MRPHVVRGMVGLGASMFNQRSLYRDFLARRCGAGGVLSLALVSYDPADPVATLVRRWT